MDQLTAEFVETTGQTLPPFGSTLTLGGLHYQLPREIGDGVMLVTQNGGLWTQFRGVLGHLLKQP